MIKELTHKDICPYYEENCIDVGCVCPKYLAYEKVNQPFAIESQLEKMNIDPNEDKLSIMLKMQKLFASKFHKVDSLTKEEVDKWIKDYDICITDEITEVHEHLDIFEELYNNKTSNKKELQKEFIDIWHFVMDVFIVGGMGSKELISHYCDVYNLDLNGEIEYLDVFFEREKREILQSSKLSMNIEIDSNSVLIATNYLLAGMRKVRQQISWKHWKKPSSQINQKKLFDAFIFVFSSLIKCFLLVHIDSNSLYDIYTKKNIENIFRQDFGY